MQIVFPERMLLSDVVVSHNLSLAAVKNGRSRAGVRQSEKVIKYAGVASRLGAELLNVSVDTSGGMASEAVQLVRAISDEGARWSAGTWTSAAITRHLMGAIAMAVQRGNAIAMLSGWVHTDSTSTGSSSGRERSRGS